MNTFLNIYIYIYIFFLPPVNGGKKLNSELSFETQSHM